MSRYRIRGKGVPSGQNTEQEDVDYEGYLSSEYSDEERVGKQLHDSDSDVSYEKGWYKFRVSGIGLEVDLVFPIDG